MQYKNHMKIEFDAKSENEGFGRAVISAFALQLDPMTDELADIRIAVSEAVTNAIIHGYENKDGIVHMECSIDDQTLTVSVRDFGKGIKDIDKAMEPLFTTSPETERAGMGFTVMESFMDTLEVESTPGSGTKVTMTKTIRV